MTSPASPIGVFDSGIGGLSILQALRDELPHEDFVYLADSGHAPYGERGDAFVTQRSRRIAQHLREQHHIKALVVACNTATTAAIAHIRTEHPDLPLVGVEPAIKPAASHTQTGRVGVIGTRGTVTSAKFNTLLATVQPHADYVVQPCDGLASAIEQAVAQQKTGTDPGPDAVLALCRKYTDAMGPFGTGPGQLDTLVLGCTHYVFATPQLRSLLGDSVRFIDTGAPVARQTRRLLAAAGRLNPSGEGTVTLLSTGQRQALVQAAQRWLNLPAMAQQRDAVAI
jgi:glutamate racemase